MAVLQPLLPRVQVVAPRFDEQRGLRPPWNLRITRANKIKRRPVSVLQYAQLRNGAPLRNGVERVVITTEEDNAGEQMLGNRQQRNTCLQRYTERSIGAAE